MLLWGGGFGTLMGENNVFTCCFFCAKAPQNWGVTHIQAHTHSLKCNDSAVWHRALRTHTAASICLVHSVEPAPGAIVFFNLRTRELHEMLMLWHDFLYAFEKNVVLVYFPAGWKLIWSIWAVGKKKKPSANSKLLVRKWLLMSAFECCRVNIYSQKHLILFEDTCWSTLGFKAQTCFSVDTSP